MLQALLLVGSYVLCSSLQLDQSYAQVLSLKLPGKKTRVESARL